jgi:hypothetical protein
MWVEWGIGRYGGSLGHGTLPGTFHKIVKNRWAKYIGVFGLVLSFFIAVYYVFIESWTLSFAYFSATGRYASLEGATYEARSKEMGRFLQEFQGLPPKVKLHKDVTRDQIAQVRSLVEPSEVPASLLYNPDQHGAWDPADPSLDPERCPYTEVTLRAKYFPDFSLTYFFFLVTSLANFYFLYRGLSAGIEQLGKIGMPILFGFAVVLAFRVITFGTPEGSSWSVADGFNFLWTPDFSKLGQSAVWLAAAGQIFFTLRSALAPSRRTPLPDQEGRYRADRPGDSGSERIRRGHPGRHHRHSGRRGLFRASGHRGHRQERIVQSGVPGPADDLFPDLAGRVLRVPLVHPVVHRRHHQFRGSPSAADHLPQGRIETLA